MPAKFPIGTLVKVIKGKYIGAIGKVEDIKTDNYGLPFIASFTEHELGGSKIPGLKLLYQYAVNMNRKIKIIGEQNLELLENTSQD